MIKEEAIKILTGYMGGKIDPESTELYQAIEFVVDILESQPSLPSDFEEAADAYIRRVADAGLEWTTQDIAEAFKAGAELMAGQGESFESTVLVNAMGDSHVDGYYLTQKIKDGDKVIVQIRKKH